MMAPEARVHRQMTKLSARLSFESLRDPDSDDDGYFGAHKPLLFTDARLLSDFSRWLGRWPWLRELELDLTGVSLPAAGLLATIGAAPFSGVLRSVTLALPQRSFEAITDARSPLRALSLLPALERLALDFNKSGRPVQPEAALAALLAPLPAARPLAPALRALRLRLALQWLECEGLVREPISWRLCEALAAAHAGLLTIEFETWAGPAGTRQVSVMEVTPAI